MRIISGQYKGRKLHLPPQNITRPTSDKVRQAAFNILNHIIENSWEDYIVLDAFAGSGAIGLEALSRGVKSCHFVEKSYETFQILQKNLQQTPGSFLEMGDLYTKSFIHPFNLVFLDPPFHEINSYAQTIDYLIQKKALYEKSIIYTESPALNHNLLLNHELLKERIFGSIKIQFWRV